MSEKILVADDSLTIQKVIGITLADTEYEIEQCLDASELIKKVKSDSFDLVLLDFGLSDSESGYDLSAKIKEIDADLPVLVMLGTFDSIDEEKKELAKIDDTIVKPFESSLFLKKCQDLLGEYEEYEEYEEEEDEEEEEGHEDGQQDEQEQERDQDQEDFEDGSDWVVDAPQIDESDQEEDEEDEEDEFEVENSELSAPDALLEESNDWGAGDIKLSQDQKEGQQEEQDMGLPPVIEDKDQSLVAPEVKEVSTEEKIVLPQEDDLDYPNLELDAEDDFGGLKLEDTNQEDKTDELRSSLEEELSSEDFWAVDGVEGQEQEETLTEDSTVEVVVAGAVERGEIRETLQEDVSQSIDYDLLADKVLEKLTSRLEEKFEKMVATMASEKCQQQVDRVAWEVIPDLAENIIKKEIKDISDSLAID